MILFISTFDYDSLCCNNRIYALNCYLCTVNKSKAMYERKLPIDFECGVNVTQLVIGGKWKTYLINGITKGFHRPVDLQKHINGATKRVLVQQLGELEQIGIVYKVIHQSIPMKVEYFLTELGESVVPIIRMMDKWGTEHKEILYDKINSEENENNTFP